jgi:hypothetical protein
VWYVKSGTVWKPRILHFKCEGSSYPSDAEIFKMFDRPFPPTARTQPEL